MAFTAEELAGMEAAALDYFQIDPPPNRAWRKAWAKRDADSQERIRKTFFYSRRQGPPFWVKYEEASEHEAFWQADFFLSMITSKAREHWEGLDRVEKQLVIFLLGVELIKLASEWREKRDRKARISLMPLKLAKPLDEPLSHWWDTAPSVLEIQ